MVKLVEFSRITGYGNTRKCSAWMVLTGRSEWEGAGYKSAPQAAVFDWFIQMKNMDANFVNPIQDK